MRRRVRRLVLSLAFVVAALSINAMSLQAGGGGGGQEDESCGFCIDFTECATATTPPDEPNCVDVCGETGGECFQSSPMCGIDSDEDTWIECGPDGDGSFEN